VAFQIKQQSCQFGILAFPKAGIIFDNT
jgi:hypothetical protein